MAAVVLQARKALADRQKDLEVKTQQLEIKLSNKHEEDIKKARRKSTQAGEDQNRPIVWAFLQLKTPSAVTLSCDRTISCNLTTSAKAINVRVTD